MNTKRAIQGLAYLYRIVEAGEKGYAVCAANMENRAIKILFKSYAQQRSRFKAEILNEITHLGSDLKPRSSIRGIIHRGRIDIFAALSPGRSDRERIVLQEVLLGEQVAVRAYERALQMDMFHETKSLVVRQYEEVQQAVERVQWLHGIGGHHLLVQLFDTRREAALALRELDGSGCQIKSVENLKALESYEGRGSTVLETSISGAVGGGLWGSVIGAIAATSMDWAAHSGSFGIQSPNMWSLIALAGILGGAFIGMMLGGVIGIGIRQEDDHQAALSRDRPEQVLLLALVEVSQLSEVQQILRRLSLPPAVRVEETTA